MFRRFLGIDRHAAADPRLPVGDAAPPLPDSAAETATVRRIVARLEALPPEEARFLASFAYVMSRAANADLDISADETALMERFAVESGGLDPAQAVLVVEMAKLQARSQGGTEDFVVTREFRSISTPEQRRSLLRCCFAIAASDGTIGPEEASVVNEIARELDLELHEINAIRDEFHDQLSAVQAVRRATQGPPEG
jgi:tellurite resistance protein